jgi:outer membrane receptor protein involved in Fe transport
VPLYGNAERYGTVLSYDARGEEGWHAIAYAEHYEKNRTNGGTLPSTNLQSDDRNVFGGRALYTVRPDERTVLTGGVELRYDRGDAWNQRVTNGQASGLYTNAYRLQLLSYAAFVQGQVRLAEPLKLVAGLRHDRFDYDIDNLKRPAASADYDASVTTPRIGLVYTPIREFELFANYGEGFRSAASTEISPPGGGVLPLGSAGGASNGNLRPPKVESRDLGFNAQLGSALRVGATVYTTKNSSEIREEPAGSGVFVPIGDTSRDGYEVDFDYLPSDRWRLYGSYGYVRARVKNPTVAGRDLIAGLPDRVAGLGIEHTTPVAEGTLRLNANYQYLSAPPFYLTGSTPEFAPAWLRYDLRASYQRGVSTWTLYAILQPKRFASEMTGTSVDPRPRVDGGITYTHTF